MKRDLAEYNKKRDFKRTREPRGKSTSKRDRDRFVVHEHHARRLHWDLRLEHEGVLVSWAIPNGIPPEPKHNRMAIHVEDHPLDYIDFKGTIPEGSYGAGEVKIWDNGTYDCEKFRKDEVIVTFHGDCLRGKYVLFQTRGDDWMIHRMDPPEHEWAPFPKDLQPMVASNARKLPSADGREWSYEIKWPGVRALAYWQPGRWHVFDADNNEITKQLPELRELGRAFGSHELVIDGVVTGFNNAVPDREPAERRVEQTSPTAITRDAEGSPLTYIVFDLLHLDGEELLDAPYALRRERLTGLGIDGDNWQMPASQTGDSAALLEAASAQQLPGIVAKRVDTPYRPGKRVRDWLAIAAKRPQGAAH